jgi:mRNA-degrading endonuclease RelE of RelBE toxin-antitoxin system
MRKLDRAANRRILQAVELLAENPRLGKMLRGELEGLWSLRVGEFRVITASRKVIAP